MSLRDAIPADLLQFVHRPQFIVWLQSLPINFHARLQLYFYWIDFHQVPYTPDEIESLKEQA